MTFDHAEILVVEDSRTQAEELRFLLEEAGYTVRSAEHGLAALELLKNWQPTVIVSDIIMPHMDGYEFCRTVKGNPETKHIPVILVTALSDSRDVIHGLASGADNFIVKPYDDKYLVSRIQYFLLNQQLRSHERMQMGVEVVLDGERHFITAGKQQILDLLISTYEQGIRLNYELRSKHQQLCDSNETLESLFKYAAALSVVTNVNDVIKITLEHLLRLPEVRDAWFIVCDELQQCATPQVFNTGRYLTVAQLEPCLRDCDCRKLLSDGEAMTGGARNLLECPALRQLNQGEIHATIPVQVNGKNFALLNVLNKHHRKWESEALDALTMVGYQLSMALSRARMFDQLEQQVADRTQQVAYREALLRKLIDNLPVGIVLANECGKISLHNAEFERIVGGKSLTSIAQLDDLVVTDKAYDNLLIPSAIVENAHNQLNSRNHELRLIGDKGPAHFLCSAVEFAESKKDPSSTIMVLQDISDSKRYQRELEHQANYDGLTGLPNRNLLQDRLQRTILATDELGLTLTVALLDIDDFKVVNESLGHDAGDHLLRIVAERLTQGTDNIDTVARIGGDEFVIIQADRDTLDDHINELDFLQRQLNKPIELDGHEVVINASFGVCCYPEDGNDIAALLRNADTAMYAAKKQGRGRLCLYTASMNEQVRKRLEMEQAIRAGLRNNEFVVWYQPQMNLVSGKVTGFEALTRWEHSGQTVSPADFIPMAEHTGLIIALDFYILNTVCSDSKQLLRYGRELTIAVNISPITFAEPNLIERVLAVLQEYDVDPSHIKMELTESIIVRDADDALQKMRALTEHGIRFSIDDFGIGYSSLGYLKQFPFSELKIDRSFIKDVHTQPDSAALARSMVSMGHNLQIEVIAEGVETTEQLGFLRKIGCERVQGFFLSPAVPLADCLKKIAAWQENNLPLDLFPKTLQTLLVVDPRANEIDQIEHQVRTEDYFVIAATNSSDAFRLLATHAVGVVLVAETLDELSGSAFLQKVKILYPDVIRCLHAEPEQLVELTTVVNDLVAQRVLIRPVSADGLRAQLQDAFNRRQLYLQSLT